MPQIIEGGKRTRGSKRFSTPKAPLISIITIVYNAANHLDQAIKSVISQSYENTEYLIIDGGSSDGSIDIIRAYDEYVDYWVSEPDHGIYDALNKGISLAKGNIIGMLSADDFYEPEALKHVVEFYRMTGSHGIIFGNSYIIQDDLNLRYLSVGSLRLWRGMSFKHQAMFVHRQVHEQLGFYSTTYRIAGDYDFVLKAMTAKIPFIHLDKPLVNYRNTGLSGLNPCASLMEAMNINRHCFGLISREFISFIAIFVRSCLLSLAGKIVLLLIGSQALQRLRILYTEKMFIR